MMKDILGTWSNCLAPMPILVFEVQVCERVDEDGRKEGKRAMGGEWLQVGLVLKGLAGWASHVRHTPLPPPGLYGYFFTLRSRFWATMIR